MANFALWILAELAIVASDIPEGEFFIFFNSELYQLYFSMENLVSCTRLAFLIGSYWNSLCSQHAVSSSAMVGSDLDRFQHIDFSRTSAVWG